MSITHGSGPLATNPAEFNFEIDAPKHRLFFEDYPRRVRALVGDKVVLDTTRGKLLYESNIQPRFYFPAADLDRSVLADSDHSTYCPFKGDASYWHVRVGDHQVDNAIWRYEQPIAAATWLGGYASLYHEHADWLVEEDRLIGPFRDPYHRVDVHQTSRRVVVTAGGSPVVDTERAKLAFETGHPALPYVPQSDVAGALERSDTISTDAYKGRATHWHLRTAGGTLIEDAAVSYDEPLAEAADLAGHVAFDAGKVDVAVDAA
jgi:uncharacterized protein (DUF427 family)